jgi:hypothetical protein
MAHIEIAALAQPGRAEKVKGAKGSTRSAKPTVRLKQVRVRSDAVTRYVSLLHERGGAIRALEAKRSPEGEASVIDFDIDLELSPRHDRLLIVPSSTRGLKKRDISQMKTREDLEELLKRMRGHRGLYEIAVKDLKLSRAARANDWLSVGPTPTPSKSPSAARPARRSSPTAKTARPKSAASGGSGGPPPPPDGGDGEGGRGRQRMRESYALIDCPEIATRDGEFELIVGLGPAPDDPGDEALVIPPDEPILDVHVSAPTWLRLRRNETWHHQIVVTDIQPYPTFTVHPTVPAEVEDHSGSVEVYYRAGGRLIGTARRRFAIVDPGQKGRRPKMTAMPTLTFPSPDAPPVDLEIVVHRNLSDPPDVVEWEFSSPHGISSGRDWIASSLGDSPGPVAFAKALIDLVDLGGPGLPEAIRGLGKDIAGVIPEEVWTAIREAARHAQDGIPSILIQTRDPHVPWELATLDAPLSAQSAKLPLLLGAQARTGRWNPWAQKPPVPHGLTVRSMAVVSGRYRPRLRHAEQEARILRDTYKAASVPAELEKVLACLRNVQPADIQALHFAAHGKFDPESVTQTGVRLADQYLLSQVVKGLTLTERPFVYLNACQVGSGSSLLGMSASMADAFLTAGATGVIAPLWSVEDGEAKAMALDFYKDVMGGVHPAEFVRRQRASVQVVAGLDRKQAARLAFQYFGHPELTVTWASQAA